ncbi:amidohydrolase family protein [Streptacidiphilus rugosus]|uniref:amidohydrolase family protein n=1 Tax=Streptacidiphilus rugosus TaxID=405783 RepID=UPI00056928C4|nr:amidohydrolase family protein [Streptacidiphilus rugosus]
MPPTDPSPTGPAFALRGRIVSMDPADTVLEDGVVYVDPSGTINAVQSAAAPPPPGFDTVDVTDSGGTVYPGLIELHNHLPYDVLQLWQVPKKYTNRSQWGSTPDYHRLVTGPMTVLGQDPQLMPAVVRYVETKALVNGTTTSQGIALFSDAGARRMYRGLVRNVEATDDSNLPEAATRIADVEASDAARFLARLQQPHKLILHLAEGTDPAARAHFQALQYQPGQWAITDNLVGIHCTALTTEDFQVLADHGGSMVWSPLSNLLLYGQTTNIAAAKQAGVPIALGSDWSVSGSKGLLGELKAARLASTTSPAEAVFSDKELVAMATRTPALILKWDQKLGSLQPGRYADLLVIDGTAGDPYTTLVDARDTDITLLVISGTARYGTTALMHALAPTAALESPGSAAPADRLLNLHDPAADPIVAGLTLAAATARLTTALANLPTHNAPPPPAHADTATTPRWRLALDEIHPTGAELRPRLPLPAGGRLSGPVIQPPTTAALAAETTLPLALDGLTATQDPVFAKTLTAEANLADAYRTTLARDLT